MPAISAGELGDTSNMCHTFSPARSNEQNRIEQPIDRLLAKSFKETLNHTNQTLFIRIVRMPIPTWSQGDF
jgi:transketolase C-terminal domain/subunit